MAVCCSLLVATWLSGEARDHGTAGAVPAGIEMAAQDGVPDASSDGWFKIGELLRNVTRDGRDRAPDPRAGQPVPHQLPAAPAPQVHPSGGPDRMRR